MTNNILIINLKRSGDIFFSSNLVNSLKRENSHSHVSLLVYDEFKSAANLIKNISNIYTIDRKKISLYKQNDLFSDANALNLLFENIKDIESISWDRVINYSNDLLSSYLVSYLNPKYHHGLKISNYGTNITSSKWSLFFNEVTTTFKCAPFHYLDCYHFLSETNYIKEGEKLISCTKNNQIALNNFNQIRNRESANKENIKIVGIQLCASHKSKEIDSDQLIRLIDQILDNPNLIPVLLIAPLQNERDYADLINNNFQNTLLVVEFDFKAASSVLMNIDALITPDTSIKHLADLVDTPLLEVSQGPSPLFKQGSINEGSLILTKDPNKRTYNYSTNEDRLTADEIYSSLLTLLNPKVLPTLSLNEQTVLYEVTRDSFGIFYQLKKGRVDEEFEIHRVILRHLCFSLVQGERSLGIPQEYLENINLETLHRWANKQKRDITEISKTLLQCIRLLRQSNENINSRKSFVETLDQLLQFCEQDRLGSVPVLLFRGKLEEIVANSFDDNANKIEKFLFELKNNIQHINECMNIIIDETKDQKKKDSIGQIFSFHF